MARLQPRGWGIRGVWGLWAVWALVWGGIIFLADPVVPVDTAEQLTWVRHLDWGYYKHPPWPTWFLWPWVQWLGLHGATAALAGWVVGAATLALLLDLIRRMAQAGRSSAAPWMLVTLISVAGIGLVSNRLHYYNHNTWLWGWTVAAAWALWRALETPAWRWWAMLGLCLAGGLLTKLQGLTTVVAAVAVVALHRPGIAGHGRGAGSWWGLTLSLSLMVLLWTPHLLWIGSTPHHPLNYAEQSVVTVAEPIAHRLAALGAWVADAALVRCGPAFLFVALAFRLRWFPSLGALPVPAVRLLVLWALVPLVGTVLSALALGTLVRPHWATAMAPWWVMAAWAIGALRAMRDGGSERSLSAPSGQATAAVVPTVVAVALALQSLWLGQFLWVEWRQRHGDLTARWGAPLVHRWAEAVAAPARAALEGPVALVIAPEPIAHSLALALPERPLAIPDGRLEVSPWVPARALERCGVLFVVYEPASLGGQPIPGAPEGLRWRVVPPSEAGGCPVGPSTRP